MKNKFYILIVFIFLSLFSEGNNRNDSLLKIINTSLNDSIIGETYYYLAVDNALNNPKQSLIYINKSIFYFKKKSSRFYYGCYLKKAEIFRLLGNLDSSLFYTNLVYEQALKNNKYNYLSRCYSEYGLVSITQGNPQKAIEQFTKQLTTIKKNKLSSDFSGIYNNIGICYGNKGDWDMAREYFLKALNDDKINLREVTLGNDYNNLGVVFLAHYSIDPLKPKFRLDSAKKYLKIGLTYRYKEHDSIGIAGSLNNLALIENETSNLKLALSIADSAFYIAKLNGYKKLQVEIYDTYDQIYSKMGNYKMAYEYVNKKNKLNFDFEKEGLNNNIQQLESEIQIEQKQSLLLEKDLALTKSEQQKQKQFGIIIIGAMLMIALLLFLFNFFKSNKLLKSKNLLISEQKHLIEEKHKDITDSITYAHRIQSSLIPSQSQINKIVKNISIFFQPRDIVSGDFYWFSKQQNLTIFALADCTGHGVPGAFMSIIGINQLNTVVNEKGLIQPSLILNELRKGVVNSLNSSSDSDKKDGMDIALISFNEEKLSFSGANQSIYILRNKELIELKGNKQPIGLSDNNQDFSEVNFDLLKQDRIILYSDGLVDQFGGKDGKKLKSKNLKKWLIETADFKLEEQKELIANKLNTFKQNFEQTDDITLAIIEI